MGIFRRKNKIKSKLPNAQVPVDKIPKQKIPKDKPSKDEKVEKKKPKKVKEEPIVKVVEKEDKKKKSQIPKRNEGKKTKTDYSNKIIKTSVKRGSKNFPKSDNFVYDEVYNSSVTRNKKKFSFKPEKSNLLEKKPIRSQESPSPRKTKSIPKSIPLIPNPKRADSQTTKIPKHEKIPTSDNIRKKQPVISVKSPRNNGEDKNSPITQKVPKSKMLKDKTPKQKIPTSNFSKETKQKSPKDIKSKRPN